MSKISELSDGGSLVSSDYLIAVRSGGNVKVRMDQINVDQVDLGDNEFIRLGNSQDLTMVHNATNSIINQAGIGDLLIQKAGSTKLTINASGIDVTGSVTADELGIGTPSPSHELHLLSASPVLQIEANTSAAPELRLVNTLRDYRVYVSGSDLVFRDSTASADRVTLDSSGNLLVGKSIADNTTQGIRILGSSGFASFVRDSAEPIVVNRLTDDGDLIRFRKDGTNVGSMGVDSNTILQASSALSGGFFVADNGVNKFGFLNGENALRPATDDAITLGKSDRRFKDLFLSGGLRGDTRFKDTAGTTEYARFDSLGTLLVGTTDSTPYNNTGAGNGGAGIQADGLISAARQDLPPAIFNRLVSDGSILELRKDGALMGILGTTAGDIQIGSGDTALRFQSSTDSVFPAETSGAGRGSAIDLGLSSVPFKDLYLSGGVVFGATGGDVTSKTLDDYEEGTWTPTITNSTGAYNFQIGRYTKIGNLVYVTCNLKTPFTNTGTTLQDIGGLPFVSENVANLFSVGTIFPVSGFNQANSDLAAQISINNTVVALYTVAPATGINYTGVTSNTFGTSVEFELSVCYRTA